MGWKLCLHTFRLATLPSHRASGSEHLAAFSLECNQAVFIVLILMANFPIMEKRCSLKFYIILGIGRVAHLVRAWSLYTKAAGLIPGQGTCKNQPVNECISKWDNKSMSLFLSLSLSLSEINQYINFYKIKFYII